MYICIYGFYHYHIPDDIMFLSWAHHTCTDALCPVYSVDVMLEQSQHSKLSIATEFPTQAGRVGVFDKLMTSSTRAKERPASSTDGFASMQLKNAAEQLAGLCVYDCLLVQWRNGRWRCNSLLSRRK